MITEDSKTPDKRYTVAKASGSKFAYVIDSVAGRPPVRFDIFKNNGWERADKLCERLNAAADICAAASIGAAL